MKDRGNDYPDLPQQYGAEVNRVRDALDRLIKESRLSRREIERNVGLSPSTLTKVLNGLLRLNFVHILVVVDGLGLDRAAFFSSLYPRDRESPEPAPAAERKEPLAAARELSLQDSVPQEVAQVSSLRQELESLVGVALRKLFREEAPALIEEALAEHFRRTSAPDTTAPAGGSAGLGAPG